jgi:hypothetical protein
MNTDDLKGLATPDEFRGAAKIAAAAIRAELKKIMKNLKARLRVPRGQVDVLNALAQGLERESLGLQLVSEATGPASRKKGGDA